MESVILTILVALSGYLTGLIKTGLDKLAVAAEGNAIAKKVMEILVTAVKEYQPKNPI